MAMTFNTDVTVNAGNTMKTNKISAPTTSGGSTYGVGTNGQILKSNGTTVYWADDSNTTYDSISNNEIDALFS